MVYRIEFADDSERDFEDIFDHLFENYIRLGESVTSAMDCATRRVGEIREVANRLATFPGRGTPRDEISEGVRFITIDNIIYWYETNESDRKVRVLAVFIGGQDHVRRMLVRALQARR